MILDLEFLMSHRLTAKAAEIDGRPVALRRIRSIDSVKGTAELYEQNSRGIPLVVDGNLKIRTLRFLSARLECSDGLTFAVGTA